MIRSSSRTISIAVITPFTALLALGGCSGVGSEEESTDDEAAAVDTNHGASDPGIASRGASAGNAGQAFPGLQAGYLTLFTESLARFAEVDSVQGTEPGAEGVGLGPTFNGNGCGACHSQPALLGSGVSLGSPQHPNTPNPQVAIATRFGARNQVPSFITAAGPIREARFIKNPDGTPDGGVHGLFTIAGRHDAGGCNATQPDFARAVSTQNVSFRIPTPTFGEGLVEGVPDEALEANLQASTSAALGVAGAFNRSGNDGTITRFGWKAQNKSLHIFVGEAYNVEQGVSNIVFPNERPGGASNLQGCFGFNPQPEDPTNGVTAAGDLVTSSTDYSSINSDVVNFALAIELSAPPDGALAPFTLHAPSGVTAGTSVATGLGRFVKIGCASCHTQSLTTARSNLDEALGNVTFRPYSDFAIHHMGARLSDGITQGAAGPDQFRTAPLWGVGQRQFFLYDGRASSLVQAILAHGGEAATTVANFNGQTHADQQAVLNFLRAL